MAIESKYWKEELARVAKICRPMVKPPRYSERSVCAIEREIMIGFFIVRRMIELNKVSKKIINLQHEVLSAPVTQPVNKLNRFEVVENYNWQSQKSEKKPVLYICNQFIHAYLSNVERDTDRNWSHLLVVSDFDRKNLIWRIPFSTIVYLFDVVSNDYPNRAKMKFNAKLDDYKITTD